MNNRTKNAAASIMMLLMLLSTTAAAANVTTFADSSASVKVELRDPGAYYDSQTGAISLPEGETITSASVQISTSMATHDDQLTYDASVMSGIWDARYNSGLTTYSDSNCHQNPPALDDCTFSTTEDYLSLSSKGFNADFESGDQGMNPGPPVDFYNWERKTTDPGPILPNGCATGLYCWGTNFDDGDYSDDAALSTFEYVLESDPIYVHVGKGTASFNSFHSTYYRTSGSNTYYEDCAYVIIQNASSLSSGWSPWYLAEFDIAGVTGISPGSTGMFQKKLDTQGNNVNGKVHGDCNGKSSWSIPENAWVLAGQSIHSNNQNGWANLAIDLAQHEGKYIRMGFILEKNPITATPANQSMQGWYIDSLRIGDPLPQSGSVTMKSFAPVQNPNPGFPDGYGLLDVEIGASDPSMFTVDVLDASNGQVVVDTNGNQMNSLTGEIIELWDIDTSQYGLIDLRFNYNSGSNRMNSPVMHAFSVGTRVGTGLNSSISTFGEGGTWGDGQWSTNFEGGWLGYMSTIHDNSWSPVLEKNRFSMPVVAAKPMVSDSCNGAGRTIILFPTNNNSGSISPVNNQWATFAAPSLGVGFGVMYSGECTLYELWMDLRFGHSMDDLSLDIASDGDIEWGFSEPAMGSFGRQTEFRTQMINNINYAADTASLSMGIQGIAQGGSFMIPVGATITHAEASFDNSDVGNATISLLAGTSSQALGYTEDLQRMTPESQASLGQFSDELQALLDDPSIPPTHTDWCGNEWMIFRFKLENPSASAGSSLVLKDLDITYEWNTTLDDDVSFARELNQGVALGTPVGGQVVTPLKFASATGGAADLSNLLVTTESGYDTTLNASGNWTGLYATGEVYEMITTHSVDAATGATIAGATLQFESESGLGEVRWTSANDSFWEIDPDNLVSLMAAQSSSTDTSEGKEITWRFRVNSAWNDSQTARIFSSLITDGNFEGLPAAIMLNPAVGNAVENDGGIASLTVYNQAGSEQTDLMQMHSNQVITLEGTVRLEDLAVGPDPNSYRLVFEQQNPSNLSEWNEIDNLTGIIGGDFTWQPAIPVTAAGNDTYRVRMMNYTGGDTVCPPAAYNPDSDCGINMRLFIDSYSPYLVNISVYDGIQNWRDLADDTWIPPKSNQKFRVVVRDIPETPDNLTLNYWVEAKHDADGNRIPEPSEYVSVDLLPSTTDPNGNTTYVIANPICVPTNDCIDDRQTGLSVPTGDPAPRTSMFVTGTDQSGNPVGGGSYGFINDLVTYIGKESRPPGVYSFQITDAGGNLLTTMNRSMYAGNVYHLLVDGKDENGWRDIDYIKIDLNPTVNDHMVVFYEPRNGIAWTDSTDLEILSTTDDGVGPRLTRLDGTALIDPFEVEFLLNLPIRLNWGVTLVQGVSTPEIFMKDLDPDNQESKMASNRPNQAWTYSSGVKFDLSSLSVEDTSGFISSGVGSETGGFVRPGDLLRLRGDYPFEDALLNNIDVKPQIPMTLEITRIPIYPGGESDKPGSGYVAASTQVDTYAFENGSFDLIIPAALSTNEYRYVFRLINLPAGATDASPEIDRTFYVKVDNEAPKAVWGSWIMRSGTTGDTIEDNLPSSSIHCLSFEVAIDERQKLEEGSIDLNWMYYQSNSNWSQYRATYPDAWQTVPMAVDLTTSPYKVRAECVDAWPDHNLPKELENVDIRFWISGSDSAGNGVSLAGQFGSAIEGGQYDLVYQEAEFRIDTVIVSPAQPEAGNSFEILLTVTNTGTEAGQLTIEVFTFIEERQSANFTFTCPSTWNPNDVAVCQVPVGAFPLAQSSVYFVINDDDGNEIGRSNSFHVKAAGTGEEKETNMMLWVSVAGVLVVLVAIIVAVLMVMGRRRDEDEDDFLIEDEDYLPPGEAMQPMGRTPPAARGYDTGGYSAADSTPPSYDGGGPPERGPPGAGDSQMERAKRLFPFWDEATIQDYFDQGWNLQQLQDWVKENR